MYTDKKGRQYIVAECTGRNPYRVMYRKNRFMEWRYFLSIPWCATEKAASRLLKEYATRHEIYPMDWW